MPNAEPRAALLISFAALVWAAAGLALTEQLAAVDGMGNLLC
jgi:hypothetical protein